MAFARRRARVAAGLLCAFAIVTGSLVAGLEALDAAAGRAFDVGVAEVVDRADPIARGVQLDAPLATDPAEQDARFTAAITAAFPNVPIAIVHSVRGPADGSVDGAAVVLGLLADPSAVDRAQLTSGSWPSDDAEVAVTQRAAQRLGIEVGDTLTVGESTAVVTGLWRAVDPADPAWFADPAIASGASDDEIGPVLGTPAWVASAAKGPRALWTVVPDGEVTAAATTGYAEGVGRLAAAVPVLDPGGSLGVRLTGELAQTMARATSAVVAARGILTVPALVWLAVGALVVGVLATTLAQQRGPDLRLLRSRGASATALLGAAAGEAAWVGALGALAGGACGVLFGATLPAVAVAIAIAVSVGTGLMLAAAALELGRRDDARTDSGRAWLLAMLVPLVIVVVAAGLSVAQLVARGLQRGSEVDPASAAAPALTLIALCLGAALLAGPAARVAAMIARRGRGFAGPLAYRRLSRQAPALTAGVLSLSLAAAAAVFGIQLADVLTTRAESDVATIVGADLRADVQKDLTIDERTAAVDPGTVRGQPGIDGVFAAVHRRATVGNDAIAVVAAPADALAALAPASDAGHLRALPAGSAVVLDGRLELTVTARLAGATDGDRVTVAAIAWIADGDGVARRLGLGSVRADEAAQTFSAEVPGGSSLLSIQLDVTDVAQAESVLVTVAAADGRGALTLPVPRAVLDATTRTVRLDAVQEMPDAMPVVITAALADRLSAGVGETLVVGIGGVSRPVPVVVSAVAPALPGIGAAAGVAMDLQTLEARTLQLGTDVLAANELWVDTGDRAAASVVIRDAAVESTRIITTDTVSVAPIGSRTVGLSAAALAAVAVLGALAFTILSDTLARRHRRQERPLRSFGFTSALAGRSSLIETASAAVFAITVGALVGAATAWLLLPGLTAGAGVVS